MANLTKAINKNFLDQVLPTFGNPRTAIPVWDNGQKMFICNEMESLSGNRYYMGVRFCDRVVIVEHVGIYHNWTYLDGLDLYAFNGQRVELIQKKEYDKVYRKQKCFFLQQQLFLLLVLQKKNPIHNTCFFAYLLYRNHLM